MQLEKEVINQVLEEISTAELVAELKKREGVKVEYAEPYQDLVVMVGRPCNLRICVLKDK